MIADPSAIADTIDQLHGILETKGATAGMSRPIVNPTVLVHDSGGANVQPGATIVMWCRPQRSACTPRRLHIDPEIAPHFQIQDVTVGNRSQWQQSQSVPCSRFAAINNVAMHELAIERIQTCMDFTLYVTNTSDAPRPFKATWTCELDESFAEGQLHYLRAELQQARADHQQQIGALHELVHAQNARHGKEMAKAARTRASDLTGEIANLQRAVHARDSRVQELSDVLDARDARIEELNDCIADDVIVQQRQAARIAELETEIAHLRAQCPQFLTGRITQAAAFKPERIQIDPGESTRLGPEAGPSAVAAAPTRGGPVDKWSRGAPCMWDPHAGDD